MKKTAKKKGNTNRPKQPKISPVHCPKNMSQKDWQRALRRQAAQIENLVITIQDDSDCRFAVSNAKTGRNYEVEYFGKTSPYNRCNCMDFRTNQIGTCKHIEIVALYKKGRYVTSVSRKPEHSSVIVDYPMGRVLMLRIGEYNAEEIREASRGLFDENGILLNLDCDPYEFIKKANEIDPGFEWEDDALNILLAERDKKNRQKLLNEKYADSDFSGLIKTRLHPYQVEGVKFAFAGGRTINADEMGLGKTVQAIATAELLRREGMANSVIIICPTSLKYQWMAEIKRFTDSTVMVVEGDMLKRCAQFDDPAYFYKICSFHAITNNVKAGHVPYADMIIYDELQRLKNWDTQMGRQLRMLNSEYVMALSGTPLENKLNELYSVTQFVDQFLLGPLYKFTEDTTVYDDNGRIIGYKNLHHIADLMKHTLLRRRKADVKIQMPGRTDTNMFVPMTKEQMAIHDEYKIQVSILIDKWRRFKFLSDTDRKRLLLFLSMMRMVCDSTFILDQKSRHDTKIDEIKEIVHNMLESSDEKVVIFSQWERMLRVLAQDLEKEDIVFCFLHGSVPSVKRKDLIDRFRDDPECRIFLSTDAGSTGLNLQSASLLINIDLPWNPAVLEQRISRIYRLGQQNPVQIINMVARGTIEERMLAVLKFKSNLAAGILDGGQDAVFIDNDKFGKIVDIVEQTLSEEDDATDIEAEEVSASDDKGNRPDEKAQNHGTSVTADEKQDSVKQDSTDNGDASKRPTESVRPQYPELPENTDSPKKPEETASGNSTRAPKGKDEVRDLVSGGLNFLSGLANVLKEPDGAKTLADALVSEDPATGKASLNIPVPDKESIVNLFASIASLLKK